MRLCDQPADLSYFPAQVINLSSDRVLDPWTDDAGN